MSAAPVNAQEVPQLIAREWRDFEQVMRRAGAGEAEIQAVRLGYWAGAAGVRSILATPGDIPTFHATIAALDAELIAYAEAGD